MMNFMILYDDTIAKSEIIQDVIGERGFGDMVVKRRKLEEYYHDALNKVFPAARWRHIHSIYELNELQNRLETLPSDTRVIHCFANFIVLDSDTAALSFEKLQYNNEPYRMESEGQAAGVLFESVASYKRFLGAAITEQSTLAAAKSIEKSFAADGFLNIGTIENFIQCIAGNFEARFFNSLRGNDYLLTKQSSNKKKIKSEYTFYHLLPDDMKMWFVMPFNYREDKDTASYTMERLHMTDLAIKWVHGSIGLEEFSELLDRYFYFFKSRHEKNIPLDEYRQIADELYVGKVLSRIEDLKKLPEFAQIHVLLQAGAGMSIDDVVQKYLTLKERVERRVSYPCVSVIGHGDPCFANVMYNRTTKALKFIDPKGALKEEDLWTNPYYDLAKLGHSVCGRYDFFNNALFEIKINEQFKAELHIDFDNSSYIALFRKKLEENDFDYLSVRVYEASLFISMLPLHIDYPHKVFGFILNAIGILNEIENELSQEENDA